MEHAIYSLPTANLQAVKSEAPFSEGSKANVVNDPQTAVVLLLQILQAVHTINNIGTVCDSQKIEADHEKCQNEIRQYMTLANDVASVIYSWKTGPFQEIKQDQRNLISVVSLDNILGSCTEYNTVLRLQNLQLVNNNTKLEEKIKEIESSINATIESMENTISELQKEMADLEANYQTSAKQAQQTISKLEEEKRTQAAELEQLRKHLEELQLGAFICLPRLNKIIKNLGKLESIYGIKTLQRVEKLLDKNNGNKDTTLLKTSEDGDLNATSILLEAGASVSAKKNYMPLHNAAYNNHVEVARLLLDHGADIEGRTDNWSATPLHVAAFRGSPDVALLLLDRKANINAQNKINNTPLHDAAGMGRLSVIHLLVKYGADFTARNNDGYTPQQWAVRWNEKDAAELLQNLTHNRKV